MGSRGGCFSKDEADVVFGGDEGYQRCSRLGCEIPMMGSALNKLWINITNCCHPSLHLEGWFCYQLSGFVLNLLGILGGSSRKGHGEHGPI
jgi:hypothetical protein